MSYNTLCDTSKSFTALIIICIYCLLLSISSSLLFISTTYITQRTVVNIPVNGTLRNIVRIVKPEVRMAHHHVHVFRKLIKACMCSVRGFARTALTPFDPREPSVDISSKALTFSPFPLSLLPSSRYVPPAPRFNLNFAPAKPKAALRFFKVTRGAISRGDLAHLLERFRARYTYRIRHTFEITLFLLNIFSDLLIPIYFS